MDALFAALKPRRTAGHGLLPPNLSKRTGGNTRILPTSAPARVRAASSAPPRLRGESSGPRRTLTAGHGVHPSFPARRLDSACPLPQPAPRRGFVQRTLLGGTALGLGLTVAPPAPAGHGVLPSFSRPAG
jgi:hypothetical protein